MRNRMTRNARAGVPYMTRLCRAVNITSEPGERKASNQSSVISYQWGWVPFTDH